jgi:hypothetical protein
MPPDAVGQNKNCGGTGDLFFIPMRPAAFFLHFA